MRRALKAYGQTAMEIEVEAASPHKLIALLYEGAIKAIVRAKVHLEQGETAEKCAAITRALAIIERGLLAALDENAGGELAKNLRMLYEYLEQRLVQANLKNDASILDECERLLTDLSTAWAAIGPDAAHP